jgi:hypothetical protein
MITHASIAIAKPLTSWTRNGQSRPGRPGVNRKPNGTCVRGDAAEHFSMHKDKPPGIFDLSERSIRYAAGFCFVVGFIVSVVVRIGVVLAREHFSQAAPWSGM